MTRFRRFLQLLFAARQSITALEKPECAHHHGPAKAANREVQQGRHIRFSYQRESNGTANPQENGDDGARHVVLALGHFRHAHNLPESAVSRQLFPAPQRSIP